LGLKARLGIAMLLHACLRTTRPDCSVPYRVKAGLTLTLANTGRAALVATLYGRRIQILCDRGEAGVESGRYNLHHLARFAMEVEACRARTGIGIAKCRGRRLWPDGGQSVAEETCPGKPRGRDCLGRVRIGRAG